MAESDITIFPLAESRGNVHNNFVPNRGRHRQKSYREAMGFFPAGTTCRPDYELFYEEPARPVLNLEPMSDLDIMIANGWGDTPQCDLPEDWRTRKKGRR